MKRAVFLDRDGVVNRSILENGVPKPPTSVDEIEILDGVVEAIIKLKFYNLVPVVVTNQPDVARGYITKAQVEAINHQIGVSTAIEYFYTCFHADQDKCNCRKPLPGLLFLAARELDLSIHESFMVGDRWRDVSAGQAAGCKTFFIDYSYPEKRPELPYVRVSSLLDAVDSLIGELHETK